ncbi:MAG: aminotransferase class III-fold pyridoxal phosphate-dependent enzyme [Candidatus Kariarchaeaceae archaeon]
MNKRPSFSLEEVTQIVEKLYGISVIANELPAEIDQNFYLKTKDDKEFVFKIANAVEKRSVLEFQNEALHHIANCDVEILIPQSILSSSGDEISEITDTRDITYLVRLLSYMPGKELVKVRPHSTDLLRDYGGFIGKLTKALEGFSHPSSLREYVWDLSKANTTIRQHMVSIKQPEKQALVQYFVELIEELVLPKQEKLRTSIIHGDANDYNIIVKDSWVNKNRSFSILDFGDLIYGTTVSELAIAAAYAILEKHDPLTTIAELVTGYNEIYPLTELELELLFPLIAARLCTSVVLSSHRSELVPENEYLQISAISAWETLNRIRYIHPRLATYTFRKACGFAPCSNHSQIVNWLDLNRHNFVSVIRNLEEYQNPSVLDLSVGSPELVFPYDASNNDYLISMISEKINSEDRQTAIGLYRENRLLWNSKETLSQSNIGQEPNSVHLGMDLFAEPKTVVRAPLDGEVIFCGISSTIAGERPTIVLEHKIGGINDPTFYTVYACLYNETMAIEIGQKVQAGDKIGEIGTLEENGGTPPHLHFQICLDVFDDPSVISPYCCPGNKEVWLNISPDPNLILNISQEIFPKLTSISESINQRKEVLSKTMSIAYNMNPLKIVRGWMQFLIDSEGRVYLDAVNNVPHVGHSNPKVVEALCNQARVLNTNTRYLHDTISKYAKLLLSKMPEPLSVCFFVNSGSEANELALRLAKTHTSKRDILVIDHAYHGNTGTLVDLSPYKFDGSGGKGAPEHVHKVIMPDPYRGPYKWSDSNAGEKYAEDVLSKVSELELSGRGVCAFFCEPLLGCGGQIITPDGYLKAAFDHVRSVGGVCVADEVQIGFGRMGTHFWGFETQGVIPDIVTMGKSIGNGHPLGAVITTPEIASSFTTGMEYFCTTGGNPVSCAVGMAVLNVIEENGLQEKSLRVSNHLMKGLKHLMEKYPIIGDVRGRGMFIGIELVLDRKTLKPATEQANYVINRMRAMGILMSTDGPLHNVLKIKPPLVFSEEDADLVVRFLDEVFQEDAITSATYLLT